MYFNQISPFNSTWVQYWFQHDFTGWIKPKMVCKIYTYFNQISSIEFNLISKLRACWDNMTNNLYQGFLNHLLLLSAILIINPLLLQHWKNLLTMWSTVSAMAKWFLGNSHLKLNCMMLRCGVPYFQWKYFLHNYVWIFQINIKGKYLAHLL